MAHACKLLFVALAGVSQAARMVARDVPLGECYDCEVTCFEDCAFKYQNEIISADNFLQVEAAPEKNRTEQLTEKYTDCLKEDKCPCKAAAASTGAVVKAKASFMDKKKKGRCAVGEMSCSAKCGAKVVEQDIASLTNQTNTTAKNALIQKHGFPVRTVKINAFAKGKLTMDSCLKYCLAATCGCEDAPGVGKDAMKKLIKQNAAAGHVVADTPKSPQYRPAKIEECAKGMVGKKVAKGLFIKLGGGPGGMYEICSKPFLKAILGPSGDIDGVTAKCKSGASDDAKYGCKWDDQKGKCIVGFSPILYCQKEYFNDPTF